MSSEGTTRGVARVLAKLEAAISAGNYYEAHQMYRTLSFRYIGQKKYKECLKFLFKGAITLANKEQYSSAADLGLLVIDTLEKQTYDHEDDYYVWINRLGILVGKLPSTVVERETIIARSIKWSGEVSQMNLGHPIMHKLIAQVLWEEGSSEQARHHYLLCRDGNSCGQMLVLLSEKGYPNEVDLFIAQVILQQLCLKETTVAFKTFETYTKNHPKIGSPEPPFLLPLLNFVYFLLKIVETGRLNKFKSLCELYKPSIDRDPSYEKYLQKIGIIFFGAPQPQQPGMGGLFGDIFNRLFQDMEEDEDEGASRNIPQRNITTATGSELD